jgi:pimeloyl-ACP methyl ester carboxylesterase
MKRALALAVLATVALADIDRGLTPHFSAWLKANNYGSYGFERTDLTGGAYGGKASDSDTVSHIPIVFFHGNSDIAVGTQGLFTGFTKPIEYFLSQGYKKSEMYITTWGPGSQWQAQNQFHSKEYLTYLRKFTEAVLAYTGAEKIHVISHSMGVTLARRVIKGGKVNADSSPYDLGESLANKVDTFIGIAGANYGLVNCYLIPLQFPTCNQLNGFYPGDALGPQGLSQYLKELNNDQIKEGANVFAIFSTGDDLIGYGDIVYGRFTSVWPTVQAYKTFTFQISCHMQLRDQTAVEQYNLITKHSFQSTNPLGDDDAVYL